MRSLRYIFFFGLLILTVKLSVAQQETRDSLKILLEQTEDPQSRVDLLINILDLSDSESNEYEIATQLYQEAKKIGDKFAIASSLGSITIGSMGDMSKKDSLFHLLAETEKLLKNSIEEGLTIYYEMVWEVRELTLMDRARRIEGCKQLLDELNLHRNGENQYERVKRLFLEGCVYYFMRALTENGSNMESVLVLEEAWQLAQSFPLTTRKNFSGNIYVLLANLYNSQKQDRQLIGLSNAYLDMLDNYYAQDVVKRRRPYLYKDNVYLLCYQQLMVNQELIGKKKAREYYMRFCDYMKHGRGDALQRDDVYFYNFSYSYFMNQGEYEQALACSDSLIARIEKSKTVNTKSVIHYEGKALALAALERYDEACDAYKRTLDIADSLVRKEQLREIGSLQVEYEVDKLELRKTALSAEKQRIALLCSICLLALVICFVIYTFINLKRTKKLQVQLIRQKEKALISEQTKMSFINSMCHEVRTPLNSIAGFSELIVEEEDIADQRGEYAGIIEESCGQLTYILNDMLEVAYLENLSEPLPKEKVDISRICRQEISKLQKNGGGKEVLYMADLPDEPVFANTNEKYFTLLIQALLNNAHKFTQQGSVGISCCYIKDKQAVEICVSDTGCGIPIDQYSYVFERFTKLDSFTQGNGLGLYLCKLIINRLKGTLRIDPTYKEGTRFICRIGPCGII